VSNAERGTRSAEREEDTLVESIGMGWHLGNEELQSEGWTDGAYKRVGAGGPFSVGRDGSAKIPCCSISVFITAVLS
jgi:hypothetical protein